MSSFRNTIRNSKLIDLIPEGYPFTWAKNWKRKDSYRARLDRVLMEAKMLQRWPATRLMHIDANNSDHLPIFVELAEKNACKRGTKGTQRRFRFEAMWTSKAEASQIVSSVWREAKYSIQNKLDVCRQKFVKWSKKSFGNIYKEADRLREQLAQMKFNDSVDHDPEEIKQMQEQLEERLSQQETLWKQRSKELWLKNGDRNTAYFHRKASRKAKSNAVEGLYNADGNWINDHEEMNNMVIRYYEGLFSYENPSMEKLEAVLSRFRPLLSEAMSCMLLREFTKEDVNKALFSMKPLKSPGPDGFPPLFYQEYWPILGEEVSEYLLSQLANGMVDPSLNRTCIVLIPKCSKPRDQTQLSPISLCNVLYRILSKDAMICKKIAGVRLGKDGPQFCHLMFADDTVLFGQASVEEAVAFDEILKLYCEASGQKVWKILTEPDSLLHKVYKNLYFRGGNFLDAPITARASYSWRSIIAARDAVKEGIMWRIGNGVNVFHDKWLSCMLHPQIHALRRDVKKDMKVAALINQEEKTWDTSLVNSLFPQDIALKIFKTPLGELLNEDVPMWPHTRNGRLTVRSAHHFIVGKSQKEMPSSSTAFKGEESGFWRSLWKLNIANKEEDGSLLHLFVRCPVALQVWALSNMWSTVQPERANSVQSWMLEILTERDEEVKEKFMILLWALWKNRNVVAFEETKVDPMSIVLNALNFWYEFKRANQKFTSNHAGSEHEVKWTAPPPGSLKINVDESVGPNGQNGIGFVIRDSAGNFIEAVAECKPDWDDIALLEAYGIKQACKWSIARGYEGLIIESDALAVVRMFQVDDMNRNQVGMFVEETMKLMEDRSWKIQWVPRHANQVAHLLASYARNCSQVSHWMNECPDFLAQPLMQDILSL